MEDPTRFFDMLRSTKAEVDVLSTVRIILAGTMASATTDLPLPSTQFTAAGFLSVQKLPRDTGYHETYKRYVPYLID